MSKKTATKSSDDIIAELLGSADKERLPSVREVIDSVVGKPSKGKADGRGNVTTRAKLQGKGKAAKGRAQGKRVEARQEAQAATGVKGKAAKPSKGKAAKPSKGKAGKGKPSKANGAGRPSPYEDHQKIVVVKQREGRGQKQKLFELAAKSKTIGGYKLAREKIGLQGLGGIFATFVKGGYIKVQ